MAKILMIIPPERFRDEELFVTKEELEKGGHSVVIASTKKRSRNLWRFLSRRMMLTKALAPM